MIPGRAIRAPGVVMRCPQRTCDRSIALLGTDLVPIAELLRAVSSLTDTSDHGSPAPGRFDFGESDLESSDRGRESLDIPDPDDEVRGS